MVPPPIQQGRAPVMKAVAGMADTAHRRSAGPLHGGPRARFLLAGTLAGQTVPSAAEAEGNIYLHRWSLQSAGGEATLRAEVWLSEEWGEDTSGAARWLQRPRKSWVKTASLGFTCFHSP